jgi:hypothetical protein
MAKSPIFSNLSTSLFTRVLIDIYGAMPQTEHRHQHENEMRKFQLQIAHQKHSISFCHRFLNMVFVFMYLRSVSRLVNSFEVVGHTYRAVITHWQGRHLPAPDF